MISDIDEGAALVLGKVSGASSSASADATADTVAGVSFNAKKCVWIPDPQDGYVSATIIREEENGDSLVVQCENKSEQIKISINDTQKMNPPKFDKIPDMAEMAYLNEASVVHNLRLRFLSNMIYTYSGLFLLAVNPYRNLPLYTDQIVNVYRNKRRNEVPPHLFAVSDSAYRDMVQNSENQSILITGESGAGKTENTKKVIQYFAAIAGETSARKDSLKNSTLKNSSGLSTSLDAQILQANPIMEAFGNAQTIRNVNSSRFGKFIRIEFSATGQLCGANIEKYLLEKSRVTHQTPEERSYHVFYQLLRGASDELAQSLLLDSRDMDFFRYLRNSNKTIDGVDDAAQFVALQKSMDIMGFSDDEKLDYFKAVAVVLLFSNISCKADYSNQAQITDTSLCEKICHLLSIPVQEFLKGLQRPKIKAGRDWVVQGRTAEQLMSSVDALARAVYDRMFAHLIERINTALDKSIGRASFIGVLDIAGFEIFQTNSFEQLCINFTNECLQQFFNTHMFKNEQEEYRRENIEWKMIDFGLDLQPTIDLIQKPNPVGILSCLDEECVMPRATDKTFTEKLVGLWKGKSSKFDTVRFFDGFVVQHYAGKVNYATEGWLEKNKDPLNENITRLLAVSSDKFFASLFSDYLGSDIPGDDNRSKMVVSKSMTGVKKGAFRTVAQRHKEQLGLLLNLLRSTQPHFVRCIVPNNERKPAKIDTPLVLEQLRCNGVLEGIRICRAGFPNRIPFERFRQQYEILCPGAIPKGFMDGHKATSILLNTLGLDKSQYRIGTSKVFFRAGVLQEMEEIRDRKLAEIITSLQALCRGFLCRVKHAKKLEQLKAVRVIQHNARIYIKLREWAWWKMYAKLKPLLQVGRVEEEMRKKEAAIVELKNQVTLERQERTRLEGLRSQMESERKGIEETLLKEQMAAADREMLLSNAQGRIATLQEQIDEYTREYNDLIKTQEETFNAQCQLTKELQETNSALEAQRNAFEAQEKLCAVKEEHVKRIESELNERAAKIAALQGDLDTLQQSSGDLTRQLAESSDAEASTLMQKRKLENTITELQDRLNKQSQDMALLSQRKSQLETDLTACRSSLADCERAKIEVESVLKRKEADLESTTASLRREKTEREALEKAKRELVAKSSSLEADLETQTHEKKRALDNWTKLQSEFDDLRQVVDDKNDQESKNSEYRRVCEFEISSLKSQIQSLHHEYEESKRKNSSTIEGLRRETESLGMDNQTATKQLQELEHRITQLTDELEEMLQSKNKLESQRRSLESNCSQQQSKIAELEDRAAQLKSTTEFLEKQVATMSAKSEQDYSKIEGMERNVAKDRKKLASLNESLEDMKAAKESTESARRRVAAELTDAQSKLESLEIDVEELRRKFTSKSSDYELLKEKYHADAVIRGSELEDTIRRLESEITELRGRLNDTEVREINLERSKARMTTEIEDLRVELEREHALARAAEKQLKVYESEVRTVNATLDAERKHREIAESRYSGLQSSYESLRAELEDKQQALSSLQISKNDLEIELKALINEIGHGGKNVHELEKHKRQLEAKVKQLQEALEELEEANQKSDDHRRKIEEQFSEFRQKAQQESIEREFRFEETKQMYVKEVNSLGTRLEDAIAAKNDQLKARKRLEAELADLSNKEDSSSKSKTDLEKLKRKLEAQVREIQMKCDDEERGKNNYMELAQRYEQRVASLSSELVRLEKLLDATERDKKKFERRAEELADELEGGEGGSKAQILEAKKKLEKDIVRLREALEQEQELRQIADEQRMHEPQADADSTLTAKLKEDLEAKIEGLEETRRALLASQRHLQNEVEHKCREIEALEKQKRNALSEIAQLKDQLETEVAAKIDEASQRRKITAELKDHQINQEMQQAKIQELSEIIALYKNRAEVSISKLENSEVARMKAEKSETTIKILHKELEEANSEISKEHTILAEKLKVAESQIQQLGEKAEEDAEDLSEALIARRKLTQDLEAERERFKRELEGREQKIDQNLRRYQMQIQELSSELDLEKTNALRYKEEVHAMENSVENSLTKLEEEQRIRQGLAREKERLEARLTELTRQHNEIVAASEEYQSQVAKLMGQIRDLRGQHLEQESQQAMLEKARKNLKQQVDEMEESLAESNRQRDSAQNLLMAVEKEVATLRDEVAENEESAHLNQDRLTRAEISLNQTVADLARHKELLADADRHKISQEKQVKELQLRIVELEAGGATGSAGAAGAAGAGISRLQARLEELSEQLDQEMKEKEDALRAGRKSERLVRDLQLQIGERDKQKQRMEEEQERAEVRTRRLKQTCEEVENREAALQMTKRRLERDLQDANDRITRLENEAKRQSKLRII